MDNQKIEIEGAWKNTDNVHFYESISLELLPSFAKRGGLDTCCDLDLIYTLISQSKCILEIGAGYGRVIQSLLDRNYSGKLVAIERSLQFYNILKFKFDHVATVLLGDVKIYKVSEQFDLILWLWSGLCDFSKEEQSLIIKKISHYLSPNGMLVLDTMPVSTIPLNATGVEQQQMSIMGENNTCLQIYVPSPEEISHYAKNAEIHYLKCLPYKTITDRERMLHILSRKNMSLNL